MIFHGSIPLVVGLGIRLLLNCCNRSSRSGPVVSPQHSCMLRHLTKLSNIILTVLSLFVSFICDSIGSGSCRYCRINLSTSCPGIWLETVLSVSSAIDGYWDASSPKMLNEGNNDMMIITLCDLASKASAPWNPIPL